MNEKSVVPLEEYERAKRHPRGTEPLRFLAYADMARMPEPEWLVEGVLQKRTAAVEFGRSNTFKSFLAIDLYCSVSIGAPWHGNTTSKGRVLYVATEGANGVGRLRIPAWYDFHQIPVERRDCRLYPKEIRLDVERDVSELIAGIQSDGPMVLVVLDIFGGTMAGSEIEDKTARAWVHSVQRIIRETEATVLTVAHTGWQDDTRARMHTHFWGSFDTRLRVEADQTNMTATLTVERHKDADSSGQWGFRLQPSGESLVPILDAAVKPSKTRGLTVRQRMALDALDEAIADLGQVRTGKDWPTCRIVQIDQWRELCDRHGLADSEKPDSRKKAFQRARDALTDKGIIRSFDGFVWRCFDD